MFVLSFSRCEPAMEDPAGEAVMSETDTETLGR